MNAWLCPRCKAIVAYGWMTAFGRYTDHVEAKHPEWAEEVFG